jgi:hypothetical protein
VVGVERLAMRAGLRVDPGEETVRGGDPELTADERQIGRLGPEGADPGAQLGGVEALVDLANVHGAHPAAVARHPQRSVCRRESVGHVADRDRPPGPPPPGVDARDGLVVQIRDPERARLAVIGELPRTRPNRDGLDHLVGVRIDDGHGVTVHRQRRDAPTVVRREDNQHHNPREHERRQQKSSNRC